MVVSGSLPVKKGRRKIDEEEWIKRLRWWLSERRVPPSEKSEGGEEEEEV